MKVAPTRVVVALMLAGCASSQASSLQTKTADVSVYEGRASDGFLHRMTLGHEDFFIEFIVDGKPVPGDPGAGGGLSVEDGESHIHIRGIGLVIPDSNTTEFKHGLSECVVEAAPAGVRAVVCRFPDGTLLTRSVITVDGRLLEFSGPCATPTMCSYKLVRGTGRFSWVHPKR